MYNQTIDGVSLAELKFDDSLFHVSKTWKSCGRGWVKFIRDEGEGCVRVRCENGAVPTVKLCNLQTPAVTDEQELAEFYDELSNGDVLARRALTHIKALHLTNKPAAQPQGEPVAYRIGVNGEWFYGNKLSCVRERVEYESTFTKEDFEDAGVVTPEPLYAEQSAPVAELLEQIKRLKHENKQMIQAATSRLMGEPAPVAVNKLGTHHVLGAIHNVEGFPGVTGFQIKTLTDLLNSVITDK